jgi:hypothetical protein
MQCIFASCFYRESSSHLLYTKCFHLISASLCLLRFSVRFAKIACSTFVRKTIPCNGVGAESSHYIVEGVDVGLTRKPEQSDVLYEAKGACHTSLCDGNVFIIYLSSIEI